MVKKPEVTLMNKVESEKKENNKKRKRSRKEEWYKVFSR